MNPFSVWDRILTFDIEADNRRHYGRFASQFHPENYVVALGYSYNGGTCRHMYYNSKEEVPKRVMPDLTGVKLVVGHNIKYDLLWVWEDPAFQEYLARGGEVYDTQYGEYLLEGMIPDSQMNAMNDTAIKYGGGVKVDAVKEMWEAGVLTSDIPRDLLVEYLVGSRDAGVAGDIVGDIMNTWLMFVGQMKRIPSMHKNFLSMLRARHDGLLATTEMEFNGLYCDKSQGTALRAAVNVEVVERLQELNSYLPELPPELEFNWGSVYHKSALFYGGTVPYSKWVAHLDEYGNNIYPKLTEKWPLFRGKPISPSLCRVSPQGTHFLPVPDGVPAEQVADAVTDATGVKYLIQDKVQSGKNKGTVKTRNVQVPNYEKPKGKQTVHYYTFGGYTIPDERWVSDLTDPMGKNLYGTGDKIIKKLIIEDKIPFLNAFTKYQKAKKDMETYYWKEDEEGVPIKGMLTLVDDNNIVHHSLNHTSTVTARLSSSNPNGQNIPKGSRKADGTVKGSSVKSMFTSRWRENGEMAEVDYSQLEVVCQGLLTNDKQLVTDLNNGVDFHIKRLSSKLKRDYQELWELHHTHGDSDIAAERDKAKVYSFQSQYGAGIATIAYDTGMHVDEVKALAAADAELYPGVKPFYEELDYIRESNSFLTGEHVFVAGERIPIRRGFWDSPTGTRYVWTQQETPKFIQEKVGKLVGFSPTELKNYPSQGLGGEIMQIMLGKVFRYFLANNRFNGYVLLVNTVHDCVWLDGIKQGDLLRNVTKQVAHILECVPQVLNQLYGMNVPVPFPVEAEVGPSMLDLSVIHHKEH